MGKMNVKQVEGAVDTTTIQSISGEKSFNDATSFLTSTGSLAYHIRIDDGWIYWIKSQGVLAAEGNLRIGRNSVTGGPLAQIHTAGNWVNTTF